MCDVPHIIQHQPRFLSKITACRFAPSLYLGTTTNPFTVSAQLTNAPPHISLPPFPNPVQHLRYFIHTHKMPSLPSSNKTLAYTLPNTHPHISHTAIPPPGPNELLIKVHAAAINPVDIQIWGSPLVGWLTGKKEKGIGRDYAGEIVGVGEQLRTQWEEGERVFGLFMRPMGNGTFTQYLTVTASDPIARMPGRWSYEQGWSYEQAAAVPLVALTALACLDWLPLHADGGGEGRRRVIVSGASGGVGTWCVQLAKKLYNCHVTGVCSGANVDLVKRLGADEVVDYKSVDVARTLLERRPEGKKYDLYIDCVGGVDMFNHWVSYVFVRNTQNYSLTQYNKNNLLHKNGAYVTIVGDKTSRLSMGGPITYLTHPASMMRYIYGRLFGPRYGNIMLYPQSALLDKVAQLGGKDAVEVVVQDVIPGILDEESDAWDRIKKIMEEGRAKGKIVVKIEH
jgi:NADPH:quinone reductase-like Zn-dependent oxidoreductase